MTKCKGITTKGTGCSLEGQSRFGGDWCHHHCSGYYASQRSNAEDKMRLQQDTIKNLQDKLVEMAKKGGSEYEVSMIQKSLSGAQVGIQKALNEMIDIIKKESEATRELIKEESIETRDTVNTVGNKLSTENHGIALLLMETNNKLDRVIEYKPTREIEAPRSKGFIESAAAKFVKFIGYSKDKPITDCLEKAKNMTDDELLSKSAVTDFIDDVLNMYDKQLKILLRNKDNAGFAEGSDFFITLLAVFTSRLESLGATELCEMVMDYERYIDGHVISRKRKAEPLQLTQ